MSWAPGSFCFDRFLRKLVGCRLRVNVGLIAMMVAAGGAVCSPLQAQTAHLLATQTTVQSSALNNARDIAVDPSGNLYIVNTGLNTILKETPSNGSYNESSIGTSLNAPAAVAVDASGNLYVADQGDSRVVKETWSGGNVYAESTIGNFAAPQGIAIDNLGNLYIGETGNADVLKVLAGAHTGTAIAIGSRYTRVALDRAGNVYISDPDHHQVLEETLSRGSYTQSTVATGIDEAAGIVVDGNSNVFIADQGTQGFGRILEETPSGGAYTESLIYKGGTGAFGLAEDQNGAFYFTNINAQVAFKLVQGSTNFGSAAVASVSTNALVTFLFDSGGSISAPAVVTQGASNLDFQDLNAGTCTTQGSRKVYNSGDVCTVDVLFSPTRPGTRYGAVNLSKSLGGAVATAYVQGAGIGPQVGFTPGSMNPLSISTLSGLNAIAADGAGNLYIAESIPPYSHSSRIVKESWTGSGYAESVIASGLDQPLAVAVDGAGKVYFSDTTSYPPYIATPQSVGYSVTQMTLPQSGSVIAAMAVDGSGNLYLADEQYGILKESPQAAGYTQSIVNAELWTAGMAVDGAGNLYFAHSFGINGGSDSTRLQKATVAANGSYTLSAIGSNALQTAGVALDGLGNVYTYDSGSGNLVTETLSGSSYVESSMSFPMLGRGLSLDAKGNLYAIASATGVTELDISDPAMLTFASTAYGSTSSDSPRTVTVANVGNAILDFPVPGVGTNPNAATGFSLNGSAPSACPMVDAGAGAAGTLAAGATCELAISFAPALGGPVTGSVVLTDNALNTVSGNYATQTISVSGAGTQGPAPIAWQNPAAVSYGTAISATQLDASSTAEGSFNYSPAAGTVLAAGIHTLTASFTPTDTVTYIPTTATVSFTVSRAIPGINWATPAAIPYGTALGTAQLDATSPVAGTFSYSPAAGTVPGLGTQTLTATFTPTDAANYLTASATTSLVVSKGLAGVTLASSATNIFAANPVTFTATLTASAGTPAGNVLFYDGAAPLGSALVNSGVATYTTSLLTAGTHSITAVYQGSGNFGTGTSAAVSVVVADFTLSAGSGGSSISISPGGQAVFSLTMTPPSGQTFPAPITFSAHGLPASATATFSPSSIAAGAGATSVQMTVQLAGSAHVNPAAKLFGRGGAAVALGLILFPFLRGRRRMHGKGWMLIALASALVFASMTGCSGSKSGNGTGSTGSGNGATGTQQNYAVIVTATSGSLAHSITVSLTVKD